MNFRPRLRAAIFAALCFSFGALIRPGSTVAAPLTLKSALGTALSANPDLRAAREKREESAYTTALTRASIFPLLSAQSTATYKKDRVANRSASSVAFGGEPYNLYNASLNLEQPLFRWGSFANVRSSILDERIAEADARIAERNLTRELIKAFYRLSLQQNLINVLLDEQKVVDESLRTAQNRLRMGGKKVDLLQVKVQAALLKPKIEGARFQLASAAAELAKLMGQTEGTSFELKGKLPFLPSKELAGKLNLQELSLPELDRLQHTREQLDEQRSVLLGKHLPTLSLLGEYDFENYSKSDLFDSASNAWSVQLLLKVPLFSGFSSIYERKATNSRELQVELQEHGLRNQVSLEQIKARKVLEAAEFSLVHAAEAANLAKESLAEGRRDFNYGIIDFLQYLQVQRSNFEAATSLTQLKYDNIAALTDYFVASGQPLATLVELLSQEEQRR